jgi:RNA polymerase sigma-70 factor (ECF subfamily)
MEVRQLGIAPAGSWFLNGNTAVSLERDELYETLYTTHATRLYAYAYRCGIPRDSIDDVVSEVFVVVWRKLDSVPDPPGDRPWLLGVARNVIAKQRQRSWRDRLLFERLANSPRVNVQERQGPMVLRDAIAHLPTKEREVVILIEWEGLTHDEVALVLGCSANASRLRLQRAKTRLRTALQDVD